MDRGRRTTPPPKAVVVGGSIAGLSCAHALISAGWEVTAIEKAAAPPSGSPTGAGVGLDPQAQELLRRWIPRPDLLDESTLPLSVDLGNSVTMKISSDMIERMHEEAENVWIPELAKVMKETKEPFVNVIYDSDPLPRLFWDNVVLTGDAAHPTSPHGLRSTNMSILDAGVLGRCLQKWGLLNLASALEEYQSIRLPVISKQVLHSRRLGLLKQGLTLQDHKTFDPKTATSEDSLELQQRNMPFFSHVPLST